MTGLPGLSTRKIGTLYKTIYSPVTQVFGVHSDTNKPAFM